MSRLTMPQLELVAAAAAGKLWRHRANDYTTGTGSHLQVTKRVTTLYRAGLLVRGDEQNLGWLWRPTHTARDQALRELAELREQIAWLRRDLDPGDPDERYCRECGCDGWHAFCCPTREEASTR